MVKNQNVEKLLKTCIDIEYRPKDNIFKTLGSYAKNCVHEVKTFDKIVKNCQKCPSNSQK